MHSGSYTGHLCIYLFEYIMFFLLFACLQKHLVDLYFMHNKVQTQVIVLFVQAARR